MLQKTGLLTRIKMKSKWELSQQTPGSIGARSMGCKCPVMDNHHGKGRPYGDDICFVVSTECPLHGEKE